MSLKMFAAVVGAGVGIVFGVKYLTERIYPESQRAKIDGPIYTYVETKETLDLRPKYKLIDTKEKTTSENWTISWEVNSDYSVSKIINESEPWVVKPPTSFLVHDFYYKVACHYTFGKGAEIKQFDLSKRCMLQVIPHEVI